MRTLKIFWAPVMALLVAPAWAQSGAVDNCEPLRERIEANIASKGVTGFTVTVVDADVAAFGEQVGTCGNGARKVMYLKGPGEQVPAPTPVAKPPAVNNPAAKAPILTECKDGSVSMGGNCKP